MSNNEKNRKTSYPFFIPKEKPNQKTESERTYEIMETKFSQILSYIKTWGENDIEELIMFLIRKIKQQIMIKGKYKGKIEEDPYSKNNDIEIFIKGWDTEKLEELILFLIKRIEKIIKDGNKSITSKYLKKMKEMKLRLDELEPPRNYSNSTVRYGVYKR